MSKSEAELLADDIEHALNHVTGDFLGQDGFESNHFYREGHHQFDLLLPGGRLYRLVLHDPDCLQRRRRPGAGRERGG